MDIDKYTNDTIYIFTDGNCKNNGKKGAKGGSGVYIPQLDIERVNIIENPTNQRAELTAIKMSLEHILNNASDFNKKNILICTDSMYSINCLTNWYSNWEKNGYISSNKKPVKNKEIIKKILRLKNECLDKIISMISFKHIKAHQREPENKYSKEYMFWKGNYIVDKIINELLSFN